MDRSKMIAVVRLAIIKHVSEHYVVKSGKLAEEIVEAIDREEIELFERLHEANLLTHEREEFFA